jgi:hypothetical protein
MICDEREVGQSASAREWICSRRKGAVSREGHYVIRRVCSVLVCARRSLAHVFWSGSTFFFLERALDNPRDLNTMSGMNSHPHLLSSSFGSAPVDAGQGRFGVVLLHTSNTRDAQFVGSCPRETWDRSRVTCTFYGRHTIEVDIWRAPFIPTREQHTTSAVRVAWSRASLQHGNGQC